MLLRVSCIGLCQLSSNMPSHRFCQKWRNCIPNSSELAEVRGSELIVVWERLKSCRLTHCNRTVQFRVDEITTITRHVRHKRVGWLIPVQFAILICEPSRLYFVLHFVKLKLTIA